VAYPHPGLQLQKRQRLLPRSVVRSIYKLEEHLGGKMKQIVALVALVLLSQAVPAELLHESFDDTIFPPPGWVHYNADGGTEWWKRLTHHQRSGAGCAACFDETDRGNNDWLVTPSLIPLGADTLLDWWYRGQSIGHVESTEVWISTTTQELDSFHTMISAHSINTNSYLPETVSVAPWLGQRIYLAIRYVQTPSQLNVYIDDLWAPVRFLEDVGVTAITVPPDSGSAGQLLYPSVEVYNWGDSAQTGFPVYITIRDSATGTLVYSDSTAAGRVMPESTIAVSFSTGWMTTVGTYWVESYTALNGDLRPENDTTVKKTKIVLAAPTVTVTVPNGGEVWQVGSGHTITWTHGGGTAAGDSIWYRINDRDPWRFIAVKIPAADSHVWNPIPNTPSESCMVRVKAWNATGSYEDLSDNYFTIVYQDVGTVYIMWPWGQVDSGTPITPQTLIENYGSRTETFPVTFRIGAVYDRTVQCTLTAGQVDTADFPTWIAEPIGTHGTMSFTNLTGDQYHPNDTTIGEVPVEVVYPERHDVGATAILVPVGTLDSGTVITTTARAPRPSRSRSASAGCTTRPYPASS
jgi:hypothetical protein